MIVSQGLYWSLGRGLNPRPCGTIYGQTVFPLTRRMLSGARCIYQAEPPRHQSDGAGNFPLKLLSSRNGRALRKKLKSLREREAIRLLTKIYGRQDFPLGYEDDVAAVPISQKLWIIVKSDMLVRSTDVPPGMTLSEAGRKSIVSTVSDFAAKGIRPK